MMPHPAASGRPDSRRQSRESTTRLSHKFNSADLKFTSAPRTVYCWRVLVFRSDGHPLNLLPRSFMSAETVFSVCSILVLPGWLLLLFLPRWRWTLAVISAGVVPFCLGLVYLSLVVSQGLGLARRWGLRFGSGSGRTVRKPLYADSRMDALSGLRPVCRVLGNGGFTQASNTSRSGSALPVVYLLAGTGGSSRLSAGSVGYC